MKNVIFIIIILFFTICHFSAGERYYDDKIDRYSKTGRIYEAIELEKEWLSIAQKKFGINHSKVAYSLSDLASLNRSVGNYDEYEKLTKEALQIFEGLGSNNRLNVSVIKSEYARYLTRIKSRGPEAEKYFLKSINILEDYYGKEHYETLLILGELAKLYVSLGRYTEAENAYFRILGNQEKYVGLADYQYATYLEELGYLWLKQGKTLETEGLYQIWREIYKATHKEDPIDSFNLFKIYESQKRYHELEDYYKAEEYKNISKSGFCSIADGNCRINFSAGYINLAIAYFHNGKLEKAKDVCSQVQIACKKLKNAELSDYFYKIRSLMGVAHFKTLLNDYVNAESIYDESLQLINEANQKHYFDSYLIDIAWFYLNQKKYIKAESLFTKILKTREKNFKMEYAATLKVLHGLANVKKALNKYPEALIYFEKLLSAFEKSDYVAQEVFNNTLGNEKEAICINYKETLNKLQETTSDELDSAHKILALCEPINANLSENKKFRYFALTSKDFPQEQKNKLVKFYSKILIYRKKKEAEIARSEKNRDLKTICNLELHLGYLRYRVKRLEADLKNVYSKTLDKYDFKGLSDLQIQGVHSGQNDNRKTIKKIEYLPDNSNSEQNGSISQLLNSL